MVLIDAGTLRGRDGFDVSVTVLVRVRLHESEIDRAAFAQAFGAGRTVAGSINRIEDRLREPVVAAVKATPGADAAALLAKGSEIAIAVAKAVRTPLFAVGLMLEGEPVVKLTSPVLQQREAEHAAVAASKAAAQHADDLLLRFEDIRRQQPDVPPGKLLMALPAGDRREALRLLFEAAAKKDHSRLFLAAGVRLFEVEGERVRDVMDIGELGPVRRLRAAKADEDLVLLIGARDGASVVDPQSLHVARHFKSNLAGKSALGFNDVAISGTGTQRQLWTTHGELGIEAWDERNPDIFETLHPSELASHLSLEDATLPLLPRGVIGFPAGGTVASGLAIATVGDRLVALDGERVESLDLPGTKMGMAFPALMLRSLDTAVAVRNDGMLVALRLEGMDVRGDVAASVGRTVTSACAVPWLGDIRIAACIENGPIIVAGPDDDVKIEYRGNHTGYCAVAASAGRLTAITGDRQRLVVWNLGRPDTPELDLHVMSVTRSRVADVAFV